MSNKQARITFYGGVGWVTGANFMLENVTPSGNGTKILVDCGMYQGGENTFEKNAEDFHYDPSEIDVLVVTHAHADHIGRIPKLVRDGFRGVIYSTKPTYQIVQIMFQDSLMIMEQEAKKRDLEPIYSQADIDHAMSLWKYVSYHDPVHLPGDFTMSFHDAGHILGSAIAKFHYGEKNIVFTGDLGNSPDPLLRDTEVIDDADYMVIESVYGDRNHENRDERIEKFEKAILRTIAENGVLLIPSFALERTQNLLYIINDLVESGRVPEIPVYLDSPLGISITDIFKENTEFFNKHVQERLKTDEDVFGFPGFVETRSVDESKAILRQPNPKIIISSAGMSHAGRIIHHEKQYLDEPNTTLLFVGYQSVGTLGRIIQDGAKKVKIFNDEIEVKARIETISGYSAHRDSDGLIDFISHSAERLQQVFVAMGETKSSLFLVQRIRDYLGVKASAPDVDDSVVIDCS
jgi:metallo-beta-lactamase family protein